jgi:hypothetical protein
VEVEVKLVRGGRSSDVGCRSGDVDAGEQQIR